MICLISPILEIFSIDPVCWISWKECLYKYIHSKKMIRKVKILSNKTPNRSRFWLQSSYFFPRFRAIDFRFSAFFFEGFFGFVPSFFCFRLAFFFCAGFRFDFTLLIFTGVFSAFFFPFFFFVSSVVIFIPGQKRDFEKISSMREMRQIIYLRLITQMS